MATAAAAAGGGERVAGTAKWDKYGSGYPGGLSGEQSEALAELLARAPAAQVESVRFPHEPAEVFGCRVLRARKYVVADALALIATAAAWRAERRVAELATSDPAELLGVLPDELALFHPRAYFPTPDVEGRPVYVERTGVVDGDLLMTLTSPERLEAHHIYCQESDVLELQARNSRARGTTVVTTLSIIDLDGMTMKLASSTAINYVKRLAAIDASYYPETLGKMLIINAPGIFTAVWAIIRAFLDERTARKIEILGGPAAWQPRLFELVGAANVPVEYGGTRVVEGGLFRVSRTKAVVLPAGKLYVLGVPVKAGDALRIKWLARPGDINYAVTFYPHPLTAHSDLSLPMSAKEHAAFVAHEDGTPIVPTTPLPACDKEWTETRVTAPRDGHVLATWDNAAGWRQRELWYRWDPLNAGGQPICTWHTVVDYGTDLPPHLRRLHAADLAASHPSGGAPGGGGAAAAGDAAAAATGDVAVAPAPAAASGGGGGGGGTPSL